MIGEAIYFELHISVKCALNDRILNDICKEFELKASQIIGEEPDTILTTRDGKLNVLNGLKDRAMMALTQSGIKITRSKIEAAILDNRFS